MKKCLFSLATLLGMTLAVSAQEVKFEEYDLSNGMHVILHQDNSAPVVTTAVMYHVGAKDENPERTGFAHFFEHLLFEGTENIPKGEWFTIVTSAGGSNNANTTDDRTYYYEIFPSNKLELGLWMESERLLHPIIKQEGVDFISYNSDATRPDNIAKLIENLKKEMQVGKIKTLVHSIAKGNLKPMVSDLNPELEVKDFQITIQAMGISLYDWVKAVFEAKLFSDDARVVSFTSEGNSKAWKNYAAVSAAKATLEVITRYVALEFARYGIRSNCIQAGVTDTASLRLIPASDEIKNHSLLRNPYARLTLPEDVANVVYLLSKDEASWINGTIIPVDGGEHIN